MRVELIDNREAVVVAGVVIDPLRRRRHRLRAGEVFFRAEVPARIVVWHPRTAEVRRPHPGRVRARLPEVAFMTPLVVPGVEIGVVVLAAGFEEVRVI